MRLVTLLCCLTLAAGCAEMRTPPASARIPPALAPGAIDPVRQMLAEAAAAFADGGRSMLGDPARLARAAAQLELVTAELARDTRWAPLPAGVNLEMRAARTEIRAALGTRAGADPDAVARALAAAQAALARGDRAAAAAALDPALFEPGGNVVLARLANPGPLPQARIATALAQTEATGLAESRLGGLTGALDPDAMLLDPRPGMRFGR
ncbi:hypothetical protein [Falsiroseomonas sp. CW058]|uniref:hypothetical protein n=1 Tax=Falsiroseomonas sp. CW058 TaxID=3388664 RepID=UPI003D31D154